MAPKTSKQFEEIRQRSMQKIEAAALELFAHKGFHNTSISQIAKAAGVSKGLLYNYYENKEDLLYTIVDHAMQDGGEAIEQFLHSPDFTPLQKISAVVEGSIQMVRADPHYWKLMTSLSFQEDVMENLKDRLMEKKDEMIQVVTEIFRQMGFQDPLKEAYLFGALLDGVMLHFISLGDSYPLEEMKEYILSKYKKHYDEQA